MSTERVKRAVRAGWDRMSSSYQAETRISVDDVHYAPLAPGERELKILGDVRGKRILELACGAAQNAIAMSKWGARTTAVDISALQLSQARRLIAEEGAKVDLVRGDMEHLGMFRDECFDILMSSFGWEFVPDLAACFSECQRVLRPGGLMVVCTVHPLAAFEWSEDDGALMVTDYFNPPVEVWGDGGGSGAGRAMTFFHTLEEMFTLLTSSGFTVDRIVEPYPSASDQNREGAAPGPPYSGAYWQTQYERFRRVPFAIVYVGRKE